MTVPDGEGGFVHLHAYKEGIFGKLDSGDEVKRCLGFKADLHARPHEVQIHCNISSDHQGCPESGESDRKEAFNGCGTIVRFAPIFSGRRAASWVIFGYWSSLSQTGC